MARYFTRARVEGGEGWAISPRVPYGTIAPRDDERTFCPDVPEHRPTDTGVLNASGETIWRAPRPIGFGRDDEW